MTIEFDCPHCHRLLRTPDDKAGLRAECPSCGTPVTVPEAAPFDAGGAFEEDHDSQQESGPSSGTDFDDFFDSTAGNTASSGSAESRRDCPACGESIAVAARRCRFCGEQFAAIPRPQSHRQKDSNLALISMVLGIVSIPGVCFYCSGLPVAIAAVVVGNVALGQIKRGETEGKGMAVTGIVCGSIVIVLAIILVVALTLGFQANRFNRL